MGDLKPCPFCSCRNIGDAEVLIFAFNRRSGVKFIKCNNCGAKGRHAPLSPKGTPVDVEFKEAADAWNAQACYVLATPETEAMSASVIDEGLLEAREAFLDMIADAVDWHDEPDGDETGDHTTFHLITHWRQMEALCLALGIKEPRYMETWADAIDRALDREPALANQRSGSK